MVSWLGGGPGGFRCGAVHPAPGRVVLVVGRGVEHHHHFLRRDVPRTPTQLASISGTSCSSLAIDGAPRGQASRVTLQEYVFPFEM
jgi:hypothetical protein